MSSPIRPFPLGSVSSGTMRADDLIPAFCDVVRELLTVQDRLGNVTAETRQAFYDINSRMDDDKDGEYYASEEAEWDLECLFDTLSELAPHYTYFGASEGDGADYGFWPTWDSIEEDRRSGELPSGDDLPEDSTDSGLFLLVSDHGNATLYEWSAGRMADWREVWSCV